MVGLDEGALARLPERRLRAAIGVKTKMFEILKRPPGEEGISCVMRVKDEADWVRLSIASILDFADEIIYVDNGSADGSLELVRDFKEGLGIGKLKIYTFPPIDGVKIKTNMLYNFAFGKATKSWCFKWDGDFIARTGQAYSIMELKEIWHQSKSVADVFRIGGPNLMPDHAHWFDGPPHDPEFCFERYLFKNRKWTHEMQPHYEILVLKDHRREVRIGPPQNSEDTRVYFYHLKGLKPDEKIADRITISEWWKHCQERPGGGETYKEWLADYWGTADREEQVQRAMALFFEGERIKRFEKVGGKWGDYPTLMKPYLEAPRYEVVYEDGKPARRVTREDREIPLPEKL